MEHVYVCHIQLSSEVRLAPELLLPPQHISTLSQLRRPRYGYELRQALAERDVPIEEGTLYPLLRRLESQGLLHSEWQTESGSPRRYQVLTGDGRRLLKKLTEAWQGMNAAMGRLLKEDG